MMITPLFALLFGLLPQRGVQPLPNTANQTAALAKCDTEIRWLNSNQRFVNLGSTYQVNLFTVVGAGCIPAELRVSAVYLDYDDNIVCSGVVDSVAVLDQNTQTTILEFRPLTTLEFVRWRNVARQPAPLARRLPCIGPDQLAEVSRNESDRASSVRIFITLLARNGGMSNLEIKIDPRR